MKEHANRAYVLLDVSCVSLFCLLLLWAFVNTATVPILTPIFFILLGVVTLFSKKLKDDLFVARTFYWVSQNVTVPRTSINHLFGGIFFLIVGFLSLLGAGEKGLRDYTRLLPTLAKDPIFWFSIVAVIALNLLIGLYFYRYNRKRNK
jgi:hypothetical protein